MISTDLQNSIYLVRYGQVPENAHARWSNEPSASVSTLDRGDVVILHTHRGLQMGTILEKLTATADSRVTDTDSWEISCQILRKAVSNDIAADQSQRQRAVSEFVSWNDRIAQWKLSLELIDLEWTYDDEQKLILYVLNDRGAETTRLALLAAAAGLGVIEVQPVTATGLAVASPKGGGCGSGGCGSHRH